MVGAVSLLYFFFIIISFSSSIRLFWLRRNHSPVYVYMQAIWSGSLLCDVCLIDDARDRAVDFVFDFDDGISTNSARLINRSKRRAPIHTRSWWYGRGRRIIRNGKKGYGYRDLYLISVPSSVTYTYVGTAIFRAPHTATKNVDHDHNRG